MKWNYTLTWITLIYILINVIFAWDMSNCTGGTALIYVIIFPVFWFITILTVGIWSYRKRALWFKKQMRISTILLLFLCTPTLPLIYSKLNEPEIVRSSTSFQKKNDNSYKQVRYVYYDTYTEARTEYWIKNDLTDLEYVKDSTWVFLNRSGDTLKTVTYKNDLLIEELEYKNKP